MKKIVLALTLLTLYACSSSSSQVEVSAQSAPAVREVLEKGRAWLSRGKVYPLRTAVLRSPANGVVVKLFAKEDQLVHAYEPILKVESEEAQDQLRILEASLDRAQFDFNFAEKEWARAKELFSKETLSESQLLSYKKAYLYSKEYLEGIKVAYKKGRKHLSGLEIKAPFNGRVDLRCLEGDEVSSSDSLVEIEEVGKLKISVSIKESDLYYLRELTTNNQLKLSVKMPDGKWIGAHNPHFSKQANGHEMRLIAVLDDSEDQLWSEQTIQVKLEKQ